MPRDTHDSLTLVIRDLARRVAAHQPEWTGGNSHDPGVTLVELLAFLAENLATRRALPAASKGALDRAIAALEAARREAARADRSGDGGDDRPRG